MSDLFYEDAPVDFIQRTLDVMRQAHWHRFQILTKRAGRVFLLDDDIEWPSNVWLGLSVEDNDRLCRIDHLRATTAMVKFLSLEPLLGPLPDLSLDGIDWVIVGGESGPKARPMDGDWARSIRAQCFDANVAFFFKQWGGVRKHVAGRELDGKFYDEMPARAFS